MQRMSAHRRLGVSSAFAALMVTATAHAGPPSLPPDSPGPSEAEWEEIIEFNREITEEFVAETQEFPSSPCHGELIAEGQMTAGDHDNWQKHVRTITNLYSHGIDPRYDQQLRADVRRDLRGLRPDLFLSINHQALTCARERGADASPQWLPVTGQVFAAINAPTSGRTSRQIGGLALAPLACLFGFRVMRRRTTAPPTR
jgi:hypothetical protein